jgi:hypothetical protein
MAGPAKFYSHSESDALAWIDKHLSSPGGVKLQNVFNSSSASGGRSLEQSLFKRSAPPAASQQGFSLVWGQEESAPPPAAASHPMGVIEDNLEDDPPFLALADLGYQFSIWAHNRRESVNKIPFAVARAPQHTHNYLAAWDQSHWSTTALPPAATTTPTPNLQGEDQSHHLVQGSAASSATQLTTSQQRLDQSAQNSRAMRSASPPTQDDASAFENAQNENAGPSKRAALIAKAKTKPAASGSGILTYKSASQKRAALQKNKHRKSILETPAPQPKAEVSKPKPTTQQRVELKFDNTPEGHKTALKLAIQRGYVDPNNDEQVKALMETIREMPNKMLKDASGELDRHVVAGGAALGVIGEDAAGEVAESSRAPIKTRDNDGTEVQVKESSKTQRLKGKARKDAKKGAAK